MRKLVQCFDMIEQSKLGSTLFASHFKFSITLSPNSNVEHQSKSWVIYSNVVSSLICTMVCTRSNISQVTSLISKYMHDLGKVH